MAKTTTKILPPVVRSAGFDPEALIMHAINNQVPVETMERLLDMRSVLRKEQAQEAFNESLATFQGECPVIIKNSKLIVKGQHRSNYADLAAIAEVVVPILSRLGLSYTFDSELTEVPDKGPTITVSCTIQHTLGHHKTSQFVAPIDSDMFANVIQKAASALTYAKRYAFQNALGILTADPDDDGKRTGPTPRNRSDHDSSKPVTKTRAERKEETRFQKLGRTWCGAFPKKVVKGDKDATMTAFVMWAQHVCDATDDLSIEENWNADRYDKCEITLREVGA